MNSRVLYSARSTYITAHFRPLNSLNHCEYTILMTNIRPGRDVNLVGLLCFSGQNTGPKEPSGRAMSEWAHSRWRTRGSHLTSRSWTAVWLWCYWRQWDNRVRKRSLSSSAILLLYPSWHHKHLLGLLSIPIEDFFCFFSKAILITLILLDSHKLFYQFHCCFIRFETMIL